MIEVLYEDSLCKISVSKDIKKDRFFCHIEISGWSLSKYKHYIYVIGMCINYLKSINVNEIFAIAKTDKAFKFNSLFGFSFIENVIEEGTNNVFKLMRLKC